MTDTKVSKTQRKKSDDAGNKSKSQATRVKRKHPETETEVFLEQPPSNSTYNVVVVSNTVHLEDLIDSPAAYGVFGPNGGLVQMDTQSSASALFVHTSADRIHQTIEAIGKLQQWEYAQIWKEFESNSASTVGRTTSTSTGTGIGVGNGVPYSSYVLLALRGSPELAHNHMPNRIIVSPSDAEGQLLDMAADAFSLDRRLYIQAFDKTQNDLDRQAQASAESQAQEQSSEAPAKSASKPTRVQRYVRSAEYDTICIGKSTQWFVPHKPFTTSTARKRRVFSAWLSNARIEDLRALQKPFHKLVNRKYQSSTDLETRQQIWKQYFKFLPEPQEQPDELYTLAESERWVRRYRARFNYLRQKKQLASGVTPSSAGPKKPRKNKGFAAAMPASEEIATFLGTHFPSEVIPRDDQNRPLLARTRVVKLLNEYISSHNLKKDDKKSIYQIGRDPSLQQLLRTTEPEISFLRLSALLNPHFVCHKA